METDSSTVGSLASCLSLVGRHSHKQRLRSALPFSFSLSLSLALPLSLYFNEDQSNDDQLYHQEIIDGADLDGDGRIDYSEFAKLMVDNPSDMLLEQADPK